MSELSEPFVAAVSTGGRPRSLAADDAILDAALDLFCDRGYGGLSIEGVACRAGVAKTTIYRRYPTKLDLVMAATGKLADPPVVPDSGHLRTDLLVLAQGFARMLTGSDAGRAIPMMLAAKADSPELATAHDEFVAARRAVTVRAIEAGIERGELAADADPALIADMLTGPIFVRVFLTGQPVHDRYLAALVDRIVAG